MGRPRGVRPEIVKVDLSDGDYIEIKKVLTIGEARQMVEHAMKGGEYSHVAYLEARSAAYITAWTFTNYAGTAWVWPAKPDQKLAALRLLDRETALEIERAIDAHEAAQEQAKNAQGGENEPVATSPSAEPCVGATEI